MKLKDPIVQFCLLAFSVLCMLGCSDGTPYTDFSKSTFHKYFRNLARGKVRLGLGFTLPQINKAQRRTKLGLLQALMQVFKMSAVQEAFKREGIDKDLNIVAPANKAEVAYDSGVNAELGNVLTPTLVQNQPTITWPTEEGAFYTLLMTDPDAPTRSDPKWAEWRHWLVVNVPGNNVASGQVQAEYIGAGPPKDTGLHRYVILVFKQSGQVTYTDPKLGLSTKDRNNTKTADLVAKYNLGDPVAGNFFRAEYDDYVPKLYEKLKG